MSHTPETSPPKRSRRAVTVLAITGGGIALGLGGAWLFRTSLAESAIRHWCSGRDLTCEVEVDRLDFNRTELSAVAIATAQGRPLAAETIRIEYHWARFLVPRLDRIEAGGARISARADDRGVSLHGLEEVFPQGEPDGPPGDWPQVDMRDASLELITPAGRLTGRATLALESRTAATLGLEIEPTDLRSEAGHLSLGSGTLNARLDGTAITGRADIEVREGAFGRFEARGALLEASLQPRQNETGDTLVFRLAAQSLRSADYQAEAVIANGEAGLVLPETGLPDDLLTLLSRLTAHAEADRIAAPGGRVEAATLDLDLQRGAGGRLSGPVALETGALALEGQGRADALRVVGAAALEQDGRIGFDGSVTARGAGLDAGRIETALSGLTLPPPFSAHGEALRSGLSQMLARFDTAITGSMEISGRGLRLTARGPARLSGADGSSLALVPFGEAGWLALGGGRTELRGGVSIELPGSLDVTSQVNEISFGEVTTIRLGETVLAPWSAGGLTASGAFDRLTLSRSPGRLAFAARGEANLSGKLPGAQVDGLSVFGSVEGVRGPEGWRMQLLEGACVDFSLSRLSLDNLRLGPFSRALCPPDGRLVRQGPDGPEGRLVLGDLSLPFASDRSMGRLALDNAAIDWRAGSLLGGDIAADRLDFTLDGEESPTMMGGNAARLSFSLPGSGVLDLAGEIRTISLAGGSIPADVRAESGRFAITNRGAGLSGTAALSALRVADLREDPFYEPVLTDVDARLQEGVLHAMGPLRLEASGRAIGRAELDLEVPSMRGTLRVDTGALAFRPGGLQLTSLSERLRGYFTDASGEMTARAEVRFGGGEPVTSRANVEVAGLGFQTVGLGRVRGVSGTVEFDDLIGLTTPPGQRFVIGAIDPGLELTGGEVVFHLTGGGDARLDAARFPFAGGTLEVHPTDWRVGERERVLTLAASGIGLDALTDALSVPGLDAEGTVTGTFPIAFSGSDVFIRDACLVAEDGGGVLRYSGETGEAAGQTNENVAMAFEALRDFRFSVLEIGADGNLADQVVVTARLEGRNPEVLSGTPFNFNISIDSQLGRLLETTRQLSGTDWLAHVEATRREAEGEPETQPPQP